jgi:hypothetical protein
VPGGLQTRRVANEKVYVMPGLEECRRFFEDWIGQEIEWPESLDTAAD